MGCSFEVAASSKLLRGTFDGTLDDATLIDSHAKARKLAAKTGAQCGIADFSAVKLFQVAAETLRTLAAEPPIFPAPWRALIVSPSDHIYGMARMFELLADGTSRDVTVVRTLDEAYRLLGIKTPPEFQKVELDESL